MKATRSRRRTRLLAIVTLLLGFSVFATVWVGCTPQAQCAGCSATTRPPPVRTDVTGGSFVGTNLPAVTDWSTHLPFVDHFKTSRRFIGGTTVEWDDGRTLQVDARGWVTRLNPDEVARTLLLTDSGRHRSGRYVVRYRGHGDVRFSAPVVHESSGRAVLDLTARPGSTGLTLEITSVDPTNPLRDLRIVEAGGACSTDRSRWCDERTPCPDGDCLSFEENGDALLFHPDFLRSIRPYRMLRFMDYMNTNGSRIRTWEERPRVEDATWTSHGVPLEIMIRLANQTGALPWFCIPHRADDDYVRSFARQVRDELHPSLPVWIEYSNELWNSIFEQHEYARARGEELGLGTGFEAVLHFQARRSKEIFAIFEEELGRSRLVRVMASQAANPWVAEQLLDFENAGESTDALAIAPYFGVSVDPARQTELGRMSVEDLIERSREEWIPEAVEWTRRHAELARTRDLRLVAYEGGQHFVGIQGVENDVRLNERFDALNRDPRFGRLYLEYLEGWREAGGGWFNHYVHCDGWSKWGRWGALEYVRQPRHEAPKYDALITFAERYPNGW